MPSGPDHVRQAEHNLQFLELFSPSYQYNDWALTVGFYSCVHIVEYVIGAYGKKFLYRGTELKQKLQHSEDIARAAESQGILAPNNLRWGNRGPSHSLRNALVKENFKEIKDDYMELYYKCRASRYEIYRCNPAEIKSYLEGAVTNIINWSNSKYGTKFKQPILPPLLAPV